MQTQKGLLLFQLGNDGQWPGRWKSWWKKWWKTGLGSSASTLCTLSLPSVSNLSLNSLILDLMPPLVSQ